MPDTYSVISQGLYKVPIKISNPDNHYTFFQKVLFGGTPIATTEDFIAMDFERYGSKITEEALKGADPNRVNHGTAFDEHYIFPAYYFNEDTVNFSNAKYRVSMNEPMDEPWPMTKRLQYLAAVKRNKMVADLETTVEKLCADVLFTGQYTTRSHKEQKFPIKAANLAIDGSKMVTDPYAVLKEAFKILSKTGGKPVNLILNIDDASNLCASEKWLTMLDNRRINRNVINFKPMEDSGLSYVGTINVIGFGDLSIYSYSGVYMDRNGAENSYIPQGKALLVPARVGLMAYGGLLTNNRSGYQSIQALKYAYDIYSKAEGALVQTKIQVQTSPAPIPTAIDKWGVIINIPG